MIKFKHSTPGYLFFIDDSSKIQFKKGRKYAQDLEKYLAEGNEIEPQYTAEELKAIDDKAAVDALEGQESELLNLIRDNEYHLTSRRKKMIASVGIWKDRIGTWDDELDKVQDQLELLREGKDPGEKIVISPKPVFD